MGKLILDLPPYLVAKPGRRLSNGIRETRYYWQPGKMLRGKGFSGGRLKRQDGTPIADLDEAITAAKAINSRIESGATPADIARMMEPQAAPAKRLTGPAPGTVSALIRDYRQSEAWRQHKPNTRTTYEKALEKIEDWAGDSLTASIDKPRIKTLVKGLWGTPAMAQLVYFTLSALLAFAVDEEELDANPCHGLKFKWPAPARATLWSPAAVAHMAETADSLGLHSMGTAILLNEWIGQRKNDLIALPLSVHRDGGLWFSQHKTDQDVMLPIDMVPQIGRRLEADRARRAAAKVAATTIIYNERTGRPYHHNTFSMHFREVRVEAAKTMPECAALKFHALRHTAVTRLAEASSEVPEIAAISGHALKSVHAILETYLIRTQRLAHNAFAKRLADDQARAGENES